MSTESPAQAHDFASLVTMAQRGAMRFANRFSDREFQGGHMFGGQLVAQALAAAQLTLDERCVASLHGYFLRPGDVSRTVEFTVEATRDGRSFSTRRVSAHQDGKPLFEMQCSASTMEDGPLDHQDAAPPEVPPPEDVRSMDELAQSAEFADCADAIERLSPMRLVEARPLDPERLLRPGHDRPVRVWLRIPSLPAEPDPAMQACMIAYLQDYWIAYAPWPRQHRPFHWKAPSVASLDSNVWFHRQAGAGWLLYDLASPVGTGGVGLTTGRLLDRDGRVVASTAQEVLFRMP